MSRNQQITSNGGSLGSLGAPSPLASSPQLWFHDTKSPHCSMVSGDAALLLLLAQLSSHTRPSSKPSSELAQPKNGQLKTLLEQLC